MKINMDELLDSMLEGISNMDYVRSEDIRILNIYGPDQLYGRTVKLQ